MLTYADTSFSANFATGNPVFCKVIIDFPSCPVLYRELLQIAGGNGSQQHLDNATPSDQPQRVQARLTCPRVVYVHVESMLAKSLTD